MQYLNSFVTLAVLALSPALMGDTGDEAAHIKDLETRWSNLYGERDLDGVMAMMAKNSVLIVPGAPPIVGLEDIRAATDAMFQSDDRVAWKSDFAYVSESGDMAYDYGSAVTTSADGTTVQGNYLVVWIRENGVWKVAADMFN